MIQNLGNKRSFLTLTTTQLPAASPNLEQQQAIHTTEGPLLIIAGPGSGKTFTLVERIYYLISEKGIPPEGLFVSTFTEKAAAELVTRISSRLDADNITVNLNEMYIGTFHSICFRFLEENRDYTRLKRSFTLLDQFDQQYFFYQRLSEYHGIEGSHHIVGDPRISSWRKAANLMKWLNKVSEEALDPEVLLNAAEPEVQALGRCYQQYQVHLEEENYLDFSTIQVEALRLLEERPEVLDEIRTKIQYLMVDEYQDTNTIQERILFKLAEPDFNLCVVGDDDQGLYRFRGATIRNILEFPENFSDHTCQQVKLTTNYRSHPDIIRFYNKWMDTLDWTAEGKTFRYEKTIVPNTEKDFIDMPTVLKVSGDPNAENWHEKVLDFLKRLKDSGALTDWNQVAFLFRSVRNEKVIKLAEALEAGGIPVYSPRSNLFFNRPEIRLMIGALIFLFPQFPEARKWREDAKLEIWDYYDDKCFREFVTELRKPENEPLLAWCKKRAKTHLHLTDSTDYAFTGLFYELLQFPLFSQHLGNITQGGAIDSRPARNLAILSQLLNKFEYLHRIDNILIPKYLEKNLQDLFNRFLRFLKDGGIDEYEDASEYAPSGCVSFMTVHQSKGLEFPVVIVGSMEAVPRKQYTDIDSLLQENYYSKEPFEPLEETKNYDFWRLFYTAFSRAQNLLLLTCQEKTKGHRVPSSYFKPLYDQVCTWQNGAFDLERLTLETIKDVDLKNEYSFTSHITVFEDCARQYKFYRDLGFAPIRRNPILFGTLVHQTIEDIHKAVLRGEEHIVTEEQISHWFNANYTHLSRQERLYLSAGGQKAALDHVLKYARRERGTWDRVRETEVEVSLVKEAYLLKGHVDLIRGEDDTVEIVDFKSEKKPDLDREREKVNRYRRQLEVYAHIIEGRTGHQISKMHLYYTGVDDGNPHISFDKDTRSIDRTIEVFDGVVDRIENKDFEIDSRPEGLCRNCDMKAYCDAM
jgi:DNA helicase-2/ATP-dependent DNA helicase PcrA